MEHNQVDMEHNQVDMEDRPVDMEHNQVDMEHLRVGTEQIPRGTAPVPLDMTPLRGDTEPLLGRGSRWAILLNLLPPNFSHSKSSIAPCRALSKKTFVASAARLAMICLWLFSITNWQAGIWTRQGN
jgi:hypothetical protein